MTYKQIQRLNAERREANARQYSKIKVQDVRARRYRIIWIVLAVGMAYALTDAYNTNLMVKGITAEQQTEARQNADNRLWYQTMCEPVSMVSGTVTCKPNYDLEGK